MVIAVFYLALHGVCLFIVGATTTLITLGCARRPQRAQKGGKAALNQHKTAASGQKSRFRRLFSKPQLLVAPTLWQPPSEHASATNVHVAALEPEAPTAVKNDFWTKTLRERRHHDLQQSEDVKADIKKAASVDVKTARSRHNRHYDSSKSHKKAKRSIYIPRIASPSKQPPSSRQRSSRIMIPAVEVKPKIAAPSMPLPPIDDLNIRERVRQVVQQDLHAQHRAERARRRRRAARAAATSKNTKSRDSVKSLKSSKSVPAVRLTYHARPTRSRLLRKEPLTPISKPKTRKKREPTSKKRQTDENEDKTRKKRIRSDYTPHGPRAAHIKPFRHKTTKI